MTSEQEAALLRLMLRRMFPGEVTNPGQVAGVLPRPALPPWLAALPPAERARKLATMGRLRDQLNTRPRRRAGRAGRGTVSGEGIMPEIVTPAMVRAKLDEVKAQVEILDKEIQASAVDPKFKEAWGQWRTGWEAHYAKTYPDYLALWWGAVAQIKQAEQYEDNCRQWREKFRAMGGKPVSPSPVERPKDEVSSTISKVGTAAIVVAAVVGVALVVRELKS